MLLPFFWMVSTSLKEPGAVFLYPPQWIPDPIDWSNYTRIFQVLPFSRFYLNSFIHAGSVTILQLITCSLAGYAFARLRFPGRDTLFMGYLATLMIPGQVVIIPNFILLRTIGWIDTYQALILPNAFSAFGTFLLRQFFMSLPEELEDAARIDGCGYFGIYWYVILPLSKPALTSLTIFTFLGQWNNFIWPLIVINSVEMNTLTVGLRTLQGQYNTAWTLLMAGSVLALLPILIMFFLGQRYFIKGVTLTGMGGR
ncbi:MAG: carbohydrate ABC transporter permease [Firmicutes bacterium]|nr:carbohydrate ABC transporter permease [Bacillota bacterium]